MKTLATKLAIGLALAGIAGVCTVRADEYPSRPVTIIVPYAPGGSTDILGRYDAEVLQRALKQTFVVENRAGAGGAIGIGAAAKAAPDGYTLLHAPTSYGLLPYLMNNVPYDPAKDFDPIVLVGQTEFALVVSPKSPVKSVKDVIDMAKAKPGELTYASAGIGSSQQLFAEAFKSMANVDIRQIPYKGTAPALIGVLSGDVSLMFTDIGPAVPLIKDGKLKVLAVTSKERSKDLPDVPAVAETLPGYQAVGWQGLFAKAGTPKPIIDKINQVMVADLKKPETEQRFKKIGVVVRWTTPAEFRTWIDTESAKWGKVIKAAGIQPQ
jgi:tripartite-type tricarboxylate transporter receptor subunit TctC